MKKRHLLFLIIILMLLLLACQKAAGADHPVLLETTADVPVSMIVTHAVSTDSTNAEVATDPTDTNMQTPSLVLEAKDEVISVPSATAVPTPTATPRVLVQEIDVGQTISTKNYDFTLNNVELIYELKPENTRGYYRYYTVENGKIYIHIDGIFYNTSKRDLCIEDLILPKVNYDNGYKYEGFAVIDDGDTGFEWVSSYTACTPLTSCHYHGLIECPELIESSDASLLISLPMADGITYQYSIR